MKKKLFTLLLLIFLLSGCTGKYEIEIYKGEVIEDVYYMYSKEELGNSDPYDKTLEIAANNDNNGDFLTYDSKKNITDGNKKGVRVRKNFTSISDYKENSLVFGTCYLATSLTNHEDYITVRTTNSFQCFDYINELTEVDIVIKSNHKLKSTNADEIKGHSYIWHINKENATNKPIELVLHSKKYVWNYNNEVIKRLGLIILILGGTLLVGFTGYNTYKNKQDKANNI